MGIKRLKKVFVITGKENSGKTRFIKEVARRFFEMHYTYTDLMHTTYADFLNKAPKPDMNDDIFGYFTTPFDCIGISSAGDSIELMKKMFDLLRQFQPDVIIIAVRANFKSSLEDYSKGEDPDFKAEKNSEYELLHPAENFFIEKDIKGILNEESINSFVDEIKKAIRGF